MAITRELIHQIRQLDAYDLRRLQMLVRGLLMEDPQEDAPHAREPERQGKVTLRQELVRCGKQGCTRCPHGPYWYAYWREEGRMRSRYVGKELPGAQDPAGEPDR